MYFFSTVSFKEDKQNEKIFIAILALLILNFSSYSDVSIDFFDNLQYAQYKNPDEWSYVLQVATYLYYFEKKDFKKIGEFHNFIEYK